MPVDLRTKLAGRDGQVVLYGTTPPRADASLERVHGAAERLAERVKDLGLDGLLVYDVQDERSRTAAERPFPFLPTMDSRAYAQLVGKITGLPTIAYKSIGAMTGRDWSRWLDEAANTYGLTHVTPVGRPSSRAAPGLFSLRQAVEMAASHPASFCVGGVAIAERHERRANESSRMFAKIGWGCSFFVSQGIYDPHPTQRLLEDYHAFCLARGVEPRRVVLTFTPCGRRKTLEFIKWLGMSVPSATEEAIITADNPLDKSLEICADSLTAILATGLYKKVPLGVNIESVSIKKLEIDASTELVRRLTQVLEHYITSWE